MSFSSESKSNTQDDEDTKYNLNRANANVPLQPFKTLSISSINSSTTTTSELSSTATTTATTSSENEPFDFTKTGAKPKVKIPSFKPIQINNSNQQMEVDRDVIEIDATTNAEILHDFAQMLECPLCGKIIKTSLEKHFEIDHREYECPFCGILFDNEFLYQSHVDKIHNKTNNFESEEYSFKPSKHENFERMDFNNDVAEMDQTTYTCPVCNINVKDSTWLELHVDSHFNSNSNDNYTTNWLDQCERGEVASNNQYLKRADSSSSLAANVDDNFDIDQVITLTECELGNSNDSVKSNDSDRENPCFISENNCYDNDFLIAKLISDEYNNDFVIEKENSPFKDNELEYEQSNQDYITAQLIERKNLESLKYEEFKLKNGSNISEDEQFQILKQKFGYSDLDREKRAEINLKQALNQKHISTEIFHKIRDTLPNELNSIFDNQYTCTSNPVQNIRQTPLGKGLINRYLCSYCDHYSSSLVDSGYGCGYRNTQMLMSSIREDTRLRDVLFNNNNLKMPSINKLQQLIERAWSLGFDKLGMEQLGGKLQNTTKWIGTSDIAALFSSLRVKVELLDFDEPKTGESLNMILFNYVRRYFETKSNQDFIHPIYLQHQGHSRTIVGVEMGNKQNVNLLIFDPSSRKKQLDEFKKNSCKLMQIFRRNLNSFKHKQYQLLIIHGPIQNDIEYENSKILKSTKIS